MKNTLNPDMVNGHCILGVFSFLSWVGGMLLCLCFNEQKLCFTVDIWSK